MELLRGKYTASGRIGTSMLTFPVVGIIAVVVLAAAYAFGSTYNPSEKLAALLPFVGGAAMGGAMYLGARMGKCRSAMFTFLASLVFSVIFVYVLWGFFVYALVWRSDGAKDVSIIKCFDPLVIYYAMDSIVEVGWFERSGHAVTGNSFWGKWVAEALIIIVTGAMVPAVAILDKPFCEKCGKWMAKTMGALNFRPVPDQETLTRIAQGDLAALLSLEPAEPTADARLRLDLWRSEDPEGGGVYQLTFVNKVTGKKGKTQENEKQFSEMLLLTPEELRMIEAKEAALDHGGDAAAAPAPAEPTPDRTVKDGFDDRVDRSGF